MKLSTTLLALLAASVTSLAGCPAPKGSAPPPTHEPPTGGDPLLSADGHHFAATRTYKGECMPAGTRGGCYSVTLDADGTFSHMLLDAAVTGTYSIDGDAVTLTPSGAAEPSTMTLSADRLRLDDFVYQPPSDPTQQ